MVALLCMNYLFHVIKYCTAAVKEKLNRKYYSHVFTWKNLAIYRYYEYIYTHINTDTQNESVFVVSHLDSFSNNFHSCDCERCKQFHAIGEKLK